MQSKNSTKCSHICYTFNVKEFLFAHWRGGLTFWNWFASVLGCNDPDRIEGLLILGNSVLFFTFPLVSSLFGWYWGVERLVELMLGNEELDDDDSLVEEEGVSAVLPALSSFLFDWLRYDIILLVILSRHIVRF